MPLFLTISEGRNGEAAVPILATSEAQAIRAVLTALNERVSGRKPRLRPIALQQPAERPPK
jgi:hypothetical protein